jgi:uncharacterized repeat protein (TIGR03803 family)
MTGAGSPILRKSSQTRQRAVALAVGLAVVFGWTAASTKALGQTFTPIHSFNFSDGDSPQAGVTIDRPGNLYGTTYYGGSHGQGEVYKLTHVGSNWIFDIIYSFAGGSDGAHPYAGALVFGPDGALYGTTYAGGNGGCGSHGFGRC